MTYPISFRCKVLAYIEEGMCKREAARLFKVSPNTLYSWLKAPDLPPRNDVPRHRKIDKEKLRRHVEEYPDLYLRERAAYFGVHQSSIGHALAKLNIRKKKERRYIERCDMKTKRYDDRLNVLITKYGSENVVYFDESGFKGHTGRLSGWAQKGQKLCANVK